MSRAALRNLVSVQTICLLVVASLIAVGLLRLSPVYGAELPSRSLTLSQATPSATDTYRLGFTLQAAETLGSVKLQICVESPLPGAPCSVPAGLDLTNAVLASQGGSSGFSIQSATTNSIVVGRTAAAIGASTNLSFEFKNITDPSSPGSYFGRISTFASADGTGAPNDQGGLAFAINSVVQVSATVPPYLYFCVGVVISGVDCGTASGDSISFGEFSPVVASVATSHMVAGTNADTGYVIDVNGTTLTSGNNVIPNVVTPDTSRPGTSQFGMNLVANNDPQVGQNPAGNGTGAATAGYNQANRYKFVPGDEVVNVPLPDEPRNYTVSYLTNIARGQAPGIYVSTLTYICTGAF